jgi:hypothetical protein
VLDDELTEDGRAPRGIRRRFENDGVARRQRRAELGQVDLVRKVPRGDRADDAHRLPDDGATSLDTHRLGDSEVGGPRIRLGRVRTEAQVGDRAFQLGGGGEHPRRADLRDGELADFLDVLRQHVLQLTHTPHPQLGVGRPVAVVERAAGRLDRLAHVVDGRVGGDAQHLFGGRIDRRERASGACHQRAVDEQLTLAIVQ